MKKNTLKLVCSEHGVQEFSAFHGHGRITLKCGCTWYASNEGLKFEKILPYREMWWEHSETESIKYSSCAAEKCKREVVERYAGDYWCATDLKRIKRLCKAGEGK